MVCDERNESNPIPESVRLGRDAHPGWLRRSSCDLQSNRVLQTDDSIKPLFFMSQKDEGHKRLTLLKMVQMIHDNQP